ncbi:MAG: carbon storage regulator [Gammaproteobacteria bacterium]|nr:carbon storage regulator [Gammaproteobacteria bacterium]
MLILNRMCGQSITIGRNAEIIVKVLRNEAGVVSIGIDAPLSMLVDRLEIYANRLITSPSTEKNISALLKRLKLFENRIKKLRPINDSLVSQDFSPS